MNITVSFSLGGFRGLTSSCMAADVERNTSSAKLIESMFSAVYLFTEVLYSVIEQNVAKPLFYKTVCEILLPFR